MKTQVKMAFSCKVFLQKRRLSLVQFPKHLQICISTWDHYICAVWARDLLNPSRTGGTNASKNVVRQAELPT